MFVSTIQAAQQLGVTRRRVSELVRTGALQGVELSGRYLIDSTDLGRFTFTSRLNGRPWDQDVAWEIVCALSGDNSDVSFRAQSRIEANSAEEIAGQINRLLSVQRYEARGLERNKQLLALTGESAIDRLGVQLAGQAKQLHAYSLVEHSERVFDAVPYSDGNLVLYSWRDGKSRVDQTTPEALVAVNCLQSENSRVREAGKDSLQRLRNSWLAKHTK